MIRRSWRRRPIKWRRTRWSNMKTKRSTMRRWTLVSGMIIEILRRRQKRHKTE